MVADALSFGETRRIKRFGGTEGFLGNCNDCLHNSPRLRVSVLSESNECNDLNADAVAFGETRRIKRNGDTERGLGFWEKARGGRATFIFSLKLSYCQTI